MNGGKVKKGQFSIYVDRKILERVNVLDNILNRNRGKRKNISKSAYWEGVFKEHLNSREVMELLTFDSIKARTVGDLE